MCVCVYVRVRVCPPQLWLKRDCAPARSSAAQLGSALLSQAQSRHDLCCCEALVSCAHSPPHRLCYCWPTQRGTQLRTRGLQWPPRFPLLRVQQELAEWERGVCSAGSGVVLLLFFSHGSTQRGRSTVERIAGEFCTNIQRSLRMNHDFSDISSSATSSLTLGGFDVSPNVSQSDFP